MDDKEFELKLNINACQKCPLHEISKPVPFTGSKDAKILAIGEAPGEQENKMRIPFYVNAPCGKELRKWFDIIGMKLDGRDANVMLANRQCCWPHIEGRTHKPSEASLEACSDWLAQQIDYSDARVLMAFGAVAAAYFKPDVKIARDVGKIVRYKDRLDRVVVLCYHPSYLLRNEMADKEVHLKLKSQVEGTMKRAKLLVARLDKLKNGNS